MDNPALMIAIIEAKSAAKDERTLEKKLKASMNVTKNHWMLTNEDDRFRAAIGAVLLLSNEVDKERIVKEMEQLKILSLIMSGASVDFMKFEKLENPIGLMKMWGDINEANK